MFSKNNTDQYNNKLAPKRQKFAIRKFTIGVASVLVGTTFALYGSSGQVLADQTNTSTAQQVASNTQVQASTDTAKTVVATKSPQGSTTDQASQADLETPVSNVAPKVHTEPDNSVTSKSDDKSETPQASSDTSDNDPSLQTPDPQVETPSQTASHVSDMLQLQTALNDKNVSEIVLDKDVVNNTDDYVSVDKTGSARKVTVWGSKVADDKTTSLNLGDYSLYFYNKTMMADHKWDLNFKNVNVLTNDPKGYGVVSFQNNGTGAKVTFDNVLAGGNGVLVYAPNADVSLHDTVVTPTYVESSLGANVTANKVGLSGKVTLTSEVNNAKSTSQNIYADGKVTVNSGANVVLTTNNSKSNQLQNLTAGSLEVKEGAKLSVKANTTAPNVGVPWGSWSGLVENSGAVYVTDGNAKVDGELTVDATTKDKNSTSVVAAMVLGASANTQNDLVVGPTGNLGVNATTAPNTRGVYFVNNNHAFGMQKGAKATFKMGHGVSNAVFNPDNLVLNEGAKLVVETYQDNNGVTNVGFDANAAGAHSGVITLDLNSSNRPNNSEVTVGNVHGALMVKKDALLKVVRKVDDATKQAATPLLSFGGTGGNNGTNSLDVDHGSVVLEDALQKDSLTHSNLGYYSYLGITDSEHSPIYPLGMVSMWGVGSADRVNVVAPKLFKMERTGKQKGMLFRLEATDNKITVTADTDKSVPVKYGTLGNVRYNNNTVSQAKNYQWDVEKLRSVNRLGDYSMNYLNGDTSGTPFGLSPESSVSFKQKTPQEAKNDFNNYFNWWSATDLEMGSDLKVYSPFYRPLVVMKNESRSEAVSYQDNDQPSSAMYKLFDKNDDLSWVKVDTTGKVTVAPTDTTSLGLHNVSVEASFDNGQKVVAYVPVMVLDNDQKVVFNGENMLVGKTEPVFTHKTSDKNLVLDPVQAVNSLTVYTRDAETGKYLETAKYTPNSEGNFTEKTTGKVLSGVKVTWVKVPTTVVPKDSSDTETSTVSAAVNVVDQEVDFPKAGTFPDLGALPVVVTMYGASAKTDVSATSDLPQTLPQAQSVISMPELTEKHHAAVADVSWKTKPDLTRPESQVSGVVKVDFVDGTKLEVPVSVEVKPNMAELNDPVGQDVYTTLDTEPVAEKGVANVASMPTGTKYSWKTPVNVYTLGEKPGKVVVTYPDGTKDELSVRVLVTDPNADQSKVPEDTPDVDKYAPQGQEVTIVQGKTPQAEEGVSNKSELPKETKYAWKAPLDVSRPGEQQGTVVVTYPDNSQAEVPVKVVVTKAPEKEKADAEKYAPQGQEVTTVQGQTPQAEEGVSNKSELPKETKYDWKTPLNVTQPGEQQGTVVVTYPDGSQAEVPVKVVVTKAPEKEKADAEKYAPQGQEVTTVQGQTPQAEAGVSNKTDLPKDTKYAWKTPLNVTQPGEQQGTVVVTYPDDSQAEVPVKVVVTKAPEKEKADAEKYVPRGQEVTTVQGQTPQAKAGVSNKSELPKDTKYDWKTPLNVTQPGEQQGTVVVTYPDGSQDEVPVKVVVTKAPEKEKADAEKYAPQGQEVTTVQGQTPQAEAGVSNKSELPKDTKYAWKTPLNVTQPGEQQDTVVVTYPDGSQAEVPVKVVVTKAPEKEKADAEKYVPQGQEVTTVQGQTPQAEAGVSNKSDLPKDTKYAWKTPLNVTQPGEQQGTVVVTYPDGSQAEVPVKVVVTKAPEKEKADAEKYAPQGQEVTTVQGQTPQAKAGVSNKSELPKDTKYGWKTPVDVSKVGEVQNTVVVTYPDGSQDEVPVKVVVTKAPEKEKPDAEKYTPQGQEVTTVQGQTPQAKAGVSNKTDLPKDTKYAWKTPLNVTQSGAQQDTVVVTYPDGSQDEVPVKVVVTKAPEKEKADAEKYVPQGQEVTTVQGQTPQAKAGVSNKSELPKDTKYGWKTPLNVTQPGEQQGTVVVTYPDGSQDEVPVKVVVTKAPEKEKPDAEKYVPQGQEVTTVQGQTPQAKAGVSNKSELPKDTKYDWKTPLNVTQLGEQQGTVVVTYPDGSQDEVAVKVVVTKAPEKEKADAEKYAPQGQEVTTVQGQTPQAKAGVSNKTDLPKDTKYSWKTPLDVSKVGEVQNTVVVTYPDGSQDEVPVKVVVTKAPKKMTDAEKYTPQSQEVTTVQGQTPQAKAGVSNKSELPKDTKYDWKTPLNVTQPGAQQGTVVVTYPDGSQDEVPVKVVVTKAPKKMTDAEKYTPQSQEVTTVQGQTPQAKAGVSNKSELPKDTKYDWKMPLNVTQPGAQQGTVVVTYPDGSQDEVPVKVVVTKAPEKEKPDAEKYTPQSQEVTTVQGQTPQAKVGVSNKSELPKDTKYDWKTPLNVTQPGAQQDTVVVTYPDGSQAEVPVKVVVTKAPEKEKPDAEKYAPQGQEVTTVHGQTPQAKAGVSNKSDLPKGTKYSWKTPLDVSKVGETQNTVVVTYLDGSQDEVPVKVVVTKAPKKMTDAEKYTPQGQEVTTVHGQTPQAKAGVSNKSDLPKDTKYAWKTPLNVTQPGAQQDTVVVTYQDGSQDEVAVKVVVTKAPEKEKADAEKYVPQGQEVTTVQGQTPQAKAGVSNKSELPKDTKYGWKTPVDVSKVGEVQNTVVVTYPDGSQDEVPVKVVVTKAPKKMTDAEKYTPQGQEVTTVQGQTPQAKAGVSNKSELPKDTKYGWKTPLNVTQPGAQQGTVVVTYPDGSQDEVPVKVVVTKAPEKEKPDAEKYVPQGQNVRTVQDKMPRAEAGVSNKSELPKGTKYSWKTPLDVSTLGKHQGTVVVTYPDSSQAEVSVTVEVDAWKNGAKTMQVNDLLSKPKTDKGNADKNAHMLKESLPQTGEDDEKETLFVGTLLTLVAGMLGSELLNKKHTKDQK